jgi:hypothetical protein
VKLLTVNIYLKYEGQDCKSGSTSGWIVGEDKHEESEHILYMQTEH